MVEYKSSNNKSKSESEEIVVDLIISISFFEIHSPTREKEEEEDWFIDLIEVEEGRIEEEEVEGEFDIFKEENVMKSTQQIQQRELKNWKSFSRFKRFFFCYSELAASNV